MFDKIMRSTTASERILGTILTIISVIAGTSYLVKGMITGIAFDGIFLITSVSLLSLVFLLLSNISRRTN